MAASFVFGSHHLRRGHEIGVETHDDSVKMA
jgi:hypothetical protein